jgi:hypothetical protein
MGKLDSRTGPAENASGIASVGDNVVLGRHEDDVCRAASVFGDLLFL